MIMAFWSSLGQTFFISLFSDDIRAALDLSHGDFGTYYAIATTASAVSLLWLGKLADTMRLEKLALFILISLCVAAVFFSQVNSVVMLVIGLYLLRMFGQGMMTHVYSTAMARRYVAARGRAISIAQLGHTLSESIGPASVVALHAVLDWRTIWIILPASALCLVAPFLRQLTRRTALQDGEGVDGLSADEPDSCECWHRQRPERIFRPLAAARCSCRPALLAGYIMAGGGAFICADRVAVSPAFSGRGERCCAEPLDSKLCALCAVRGDWQPDHRPVDRQVFSAACRTA
jgi:MFS family permease